MEAQRKFKIMKSKLESMNYKQPFSADSLVLIEALLNDIINLNSSLSRLRAQKPDTEATRDLCERIEQLTKEKLYLESQIKDLSGSHSDNLSLANSRLQKENKMLAGKLLSLQSTDIYASGERNKENIEKVLADFNFLRYQLEDSAKLIQQLQNEKDNLLERIKEVEIRNECLKNELDLSRATIKDLYQESRPNADELYSMKSVLSAYETKGEYYEKEIHRASIENKKLQKYIQGLEQQIASLNKDLSLGKSELELVSNSNIKTASVIDSYKNKIESLQSENYKLISLREDDRKRIADLDGSCREAQDKIKVLQKESIAFCQTIKENDERIRINNKDKTDVEMELRELKSVDARYEESLKENKKIKSLLQDLTLQNSRLNNEVEELRGSLKYKEEDVRQYRSYLEQSNRDIEILKKNLTEEANKNYNLTNVISNSKYIEGQLKTVNNQLDETAHRETQLYKEYQKLQMLLEEAELKIQASQNYSENLQSKLAMIEQEKCTLNRYVSELASKDNSQSLEIIQYENLKQELMSTVERLGQKIQVLEDLNFSLSDELNDKNRILSSGQNHASRQADQIAQLRDFISSLENSRSELIKKIECYQDSDKEKDKAIFKQRESLDIMQRDLMSSERNLNEILKERERLINELNSLKFDLKCQADELLLSKENHKKSIIAVNECKSTIKSMQESEENFKRSWRDSEVERNKLNDNLLQLNLQIEDSRKTSSMLKHQMQEKANEISVLESRLKSLEENSRAIIYERDSLNFRIDELSNELRAKVDKISGLNRENDELRHKLRSASEEREKIARAYDFLNLDYKKLTGKATATENMSENLQKQEDAYVKKLNNLEDELRRTMRTLEISEYKRLEAEKTSETLLKERRPTPCFVQETDYDKEDLLKKLANIENERKYLEGKCRAAENEADSLRFQLDYEKQKVACKSYAATEVFKIVDNEESNSKINNLSRQVELYKTEALKFEMNYMKVLDELNQVKHLLNRSEARVNELQLLRR